MQEVCKAWRGGLTSDVSLLQHRRGEALIDVAHVDLARDRERHEIEAKVPLKVLRVVLDRAVCGPSELLLHLVPRAVWDDGLVEEVPVDGGAHVEALALAVPQVDVAVGREDHAGPRLEAVEKDGVLWVGLGLGDRKSVV